MTRLEAVDGVRADLGAMRAPDPIAAVMREVEARLTEVAVGFDRAGIARHLLSAGGRRMRPRLVVASAVAAGGIGGISRMVTDAAVAVELLHLASLCHDDVLDRATVRRGHASANARWGDRIAVLAGDALLAAAFSAFTGFRPEQLRRFCQTVGDMCAGQIDETTRQFDPSRSIADYEATIYHKTATLTSTSCWLGAVTVDAPDWVARALDEYGSELGLAFQIVDDVLDVCVDGSVAGKPSGADLRQGVFTLPVLLAVVDDPVLLELLSDSAGGDQIGEVRRRVRAVDGDSRAAQVAVEHIDRATSAVSRCFDADGRRTLVSIAASVIEPVQRLGLVMR